VSDEFELLPISRDAIPQALEKADRYRLLNEPEGAESICLDVLDVDPANQRALRTLVLALTDQFGARHTAAVTRGYVERLTDAYEGAYYNGVVCERHARAMLTRTHVRRGLYEAFVEALGWYKQADGLRPAGNDEARLRWNSCVRTIRHENLVPMPPDEGELPLE
jgi:hypothetical protein